MSNKNIINSNRKGFFEKVGSMYPHYDFSEFVYTGVRDHSVVVCIYHGPFTANRSCLYQARNNPCPECRKDKHRLSAGNFIDRANKIHNNKYSYNKKSIECSGWRDYITITCPIHGEFKQSKGSHLTGCGCKDCYIEKLPSKSSSGLLKFYKSTEKLRFDDFIEKAIIKFNNRYDYTNSEYSNSYTKILINCPDHGEFYQTPYRHLQSQTGCPNCSKAKSGVNYVKSYSKSFIGEEIGTFYKLLFTHNKTGIKFIKIGITSKTIFDRYKKGHEDFSYEIIDQIQATNLQCAIKEQIYKNKNLHKRFFLPLDIIFSGRTECYVYDDTQQLKTNGIWFIRESLLQKQNGLCAICGKHPNRPVLDHDHKKRLGGSTYCRGTLCSNCNIMLAKVENNALRYGFSQDELPNILRMLADYKQDDHTNYIHPSEKPKAKKLTKLSYNRLKKFYEGNAKFPDYPKTGILTVKLKELFEKYHIQPEFYK